MNYFKRVKRSLYIFFTILAVVIIVSYTLGTILTVNLDNEYIIISILILSFVLLPISVLLFNKFIFNKLRINAIKVVFNSLDKDKLVYTRKKEESYEALDAFSMAQVAPEFVISSVIDGTYKDINVTSYFLEYSSDMKRKNEKLSRFYIFAFDKKIEEKYNISDFSSRLLNKSESAKVKVIDNKLYIVYTNSKKSYKYQLEPLAFDDYDSFKERFEEEIKLIDNVISVVKGE